MVGGPSEHQCRCKDKPKVRTYLPKAKMGRRCEIKNCQNNDSRLDKWKAEECQIHKWPHSSCGCVPPFTFYPFPSMTSQFLVFREWVKVVVESDPSRPRAWLPRQHSRVCSKHFLAGEPTPEHPVPIYGSNENVSEVSRQVHEEEQLDRKIKVELVENVDEYGLRSDQLSLDTNTKDVAQNSDNSVLCYARSPYKAFLEDHNYSLTPRHRPISYQECDCGEKLKLENGVAEETCDLKPEVLPESEMGQTSSNSSLSSRITTNDGNSGEELREFDVDLEPKLKTPKVKLDEICSGPGEKSADAAFRRFLRTLGRSESYLTDYTRQELDEVLAEFWCRVKKKDGSELFPILLYTYRSGLQRIFAKNTDGPAGHCNIVGIREFPISCAAFEARIESLKEQKRIRTRGKGQATIQDEREVTVPPDPLGFPQSTSTANLDCDRGDGFELGDGEVDETGDLRPEMLPTPETGGVSSLSSRRTKDGGDDEIEFIEFDMDPQYKSWAERAEKSSDTAFRRFLQRLGRSESYLTEYTRKDLDEVLARFWREARRENLLKLQSRTLYVYRLGLRRIFARNAEGPAAHCIITVRTEFPLSCAAFDARVEGLRKQKRMRIRAQRQSMIEEERDVSVPAEDPLELAQDETWGDAEKSADTAFRRFLRTLGRSESYLTEYKRKDLDEVLGTFWYEVRKEDGSELHIATLYVYRCGLKRILAKNADGPAAHCNIEVSTDFPISSAAFEAKIKCLKEQKQMRTWEQWQATIRGEIEETVPLKDPLEFPDSTQTPDLSQECGCGDEFGDVEVELASDLRLVQSKLDPPTGTYPEPRVGRPKVQRDKSWGHAEKSGDTAFRRFLRTLGKSESYLTEYTVKDLDEILARFWHEVKKEDGTELQYCTLKVYRLGLRRILSKNTDGPAARCLITFPPDFPKSSAAYEARIEHQKEQKRMKTWKEDLQATIQKEREGTVEEETEVTVPPGDRFQFGESAWTHCLSQKRECDFEYATDNTDMSEDEDAETLAVGRHKTAKTERWNSRSCQEGDELGNTMLDLCGQNENDALSLPEEPHHKRQKTDDSGIVLKEEKASASECHPENEDLSSDDDFLAEREAEPKRQKKSGFDDLVSLKDENSPFLPERRISVREKTFLRLFEHFARVQEECFSLRKDVKKDLDKVLAAFWENVKKDDGFELQARTLKCYNGYLRKFFCMNNNGVARHWDINNAFDFPLAVVAFEKKLKCLRDAEEEEDLDNSDSAGASVRKRKLKEVLTKTALGLLENFLLGQGRSTCVKKDYSKEELDDILADFWLSVKKQDGSEFRAGSLQFYRSSLSVAFRENKDGPAAHCNINNSSDFPRSSMAFRERQRDLIASEGGTSLEKSEIRLSSSEKADLYRRRGVDVVRTLLHKQGRSISDVELCTTEDLDEILATFWRSLERKNRSDLPLRSLRNYKWTLKKFFSENKHGPAAYCNINDAIEFPRSTAAYNERLKELNTAEINKCLENYDSAALSLMKKKKRELRIRRAVRMLQKFLETQEKSTSVLKDYNKKELDELLTSFWSNVKKKDGSDFRAETLREYLKLLGRYFRESKDGPAALSNIEDPTDFRKSLEAHKQRCETLRKAEIEKCSNASKRDEVKVVNLLQDFLKKRGKSEHFLTDYQKEDLDAVLADFWRNLLKKDGRGHQVQTLIVYRRALRRKLLTNPDGPAPHCDLMLRENFPKAIVAFKERVKSLREKENSEELPWSEDTQTQDDFVGCTEKKETVDCESESEGMDLSADSFSGGGSVRSHRSYGETRTEAREDSSGDKEISGEQPTTRRSARTGRTTTRLQEWDSASENESEEWDSSEDDDWEPEIPEDRK